MFLALGEMTDREISQEDLSAACAPMAWAPDRRHLQHLPLHQLLAERRPGGVTGVKSRWVCVAGGVILIVLGLLPKMAALVESLPAVVLGGAGLG